MKNLLFVIALATLLVSCKKDKKEDFKATDVTGTGTISGHVNKNVVTPDGGGSFTNSSRVPAKGIRVSVKINKNQLYPNSNAQGADVYTATTDSLGNYNISVKTNANGVNASISIEGFAATLDTIINGVVKPGFYATYAGSNQNITVVMGQGYQINHNFTASNISSNPNTIVVGSAVITGSVGMSVVKEFSVSGFPISYVNEIVAVPAGHIVYLNFQNDPATLSAKTYTAVTNANGFYTFNVSTVDQNTAGFSQNADIWINDFAKTRDTLTLSGAVKTGPAGVFQMETTSQNGVYSNTIKNATHLSYTNFTEN